MVKVTAIGENKAPAAKAEPAKAEAAADVKPSLSMKKDELLAIAQSKGISVSSKATKADILAAIEEN